MTTTDRPLDRDERLLVLLYVFIGGGALSGASVTALTLVPAQSAPAFPRAIGAGLVAMAAATAGLLATALAYFAAAWRAGRLDARVGRALPIALFFLGALAAPWTRLVLAFPRFLNLAAAVGMALGAILAASMWYAARGTNRVSRLCALLNVWQYGAMSLGLVLAGHPFPLMGLAIGAELFAVVLGLQEHRLLEPGFLGGARRHVTPAVPLAIVAIAMVLYLTALSGRDPIANGGSSACATAPVEPVPISACRASARL